MVWGPDHRPRADACGAEQASAGLDAGVPADLHVDVDPGAAGIDDRHSGAHVALVDGALGEPPNLVEGDPIVDAQHQAGIVHDVRGHALAVGAQQVQGLWEIQLALGVVRGQPRQGTQQRGAVEDVDAGVDLANLKLGGGGVPGRLGLDHALDGALRVAHHTPVAAGIVEQGGGHRRGGPRLFVGDDEPGDGPSIDERDIAAENHDGVLTVEQVDRGAYGAAGPVGDGLDDQLDPRGQHGLKRPGGSVDDYDLAGPGLQRGLHGPEQHRPPAQLVQDLGRRRAHAGSLAGGEDQDGG